MKKPDIEDFQDYGSLHEAFPIGMRVLVVDDDPLCLMILKRMLLQCKYQVTACSRAIEALQLLRERKSKFDLVISDVYMPDIDGFKLLELIGLEMDLPVIMMSANGETSVVMKGITHGACDYLLKPVRIEELRNIWQHVVRKRSMREIVKEESSGEYDECERFPEYSSKKRKEKFDSSSDEQIDDISGLKKPRVVWTGDLHRLFVKAVNQLGVEKAVPKRILEIMNVQGLTRENVASHLQKYRLGLKRLSGVDMEPHPIASFQADDTGSFGGSMYIRPGGGSHKTPRSRSPQCGSGVFGRNLNQLDSGTLAALKQLQSMQHRGNSPSPSPSSVSSAQVLKGSRALKMRQTATSGIHRATSIELGSLKVHSDWIPNTWQGNTNANTVIIKEESSPRSGSNSTVEEMDISRAFTEPADKVSSPVPFEQVSSPVAFGLGKITEESTAVPQDLAEFCIGSPDYFAVFQQQQNWSTEY